MFVSYDAHGSYELHKYYITHRLYVTLLLNLLYTNHIFKSLFLSFFLYSYSLITSGGQIKLFKFCKQCELHVAYI